MMIELAPGEQLIRAPDGWPAGLVAVSRGEVELVCRGGASARFGEGSLVWLRGIGLCAVRNVGGVPAELVALSRVGVDPVAGV
jgi:hypothetical protein